MTAPTKREIGPILMGAGVFVVSTYAAMHQFIFPRSEAEAAIFTLNQRINAAEQAEKDDRKQYLDDIHEIRQFIYSHKN